MDLKLREMIETYLCPGCVFGSDVECGAYKAPRYYSGCVGHVLGTFLSGGIGSIALGMPKGFNRPGPADEPGDQHMTCPRHRNTMTIRLHVSPTDDLPEWNRLNVPVWALVRDGALFVRTYMPRINATAVDVVQGGTLDLVPGAVNVGDFYDEID